ncbi:WxL domain-containing protein [Streptomyces sp. NBC_00335]|uniref:hypothetical protein n=1 Tax=unclassified Streptomyces TaxID=2593676 RepID=UPI002256D9B7|nr:MULTISPECIES: hypothetical protein [unclassified Streptomyces]MCX5403707.1 WxL domain-containing protein [Streptomyces sp. NBC_00086]
MTTALALAGAVLAPAAQAGTIRPTVHCVLPAGQGDPSGPQDVTVELSPATVAPGGKVHAKITLGPGPAVSPMKLDDVPSTPSIDLVMSGGATGKVTVQGPTVLVDVPMQPAPIVIPPYEGDFFVPANASGPIQFTPVKMNTATVVFGGNYNTPCEVVSGGGVVATVTAEGGGGAEATVSAPTGSVKPSTSVPLSGGGWTPGATATPTLCDAGGGGCDATKVTGSSLVIDASGALSGAITLANSWTIADGSYAVQVSDGTKQARAPLQVKAHVPAGPYELRAYPDRAALGSVITVSGKNYHQDQQLNVVALDAEGNTLDDTAVYPSTTTDGTFTTEFTISDPAIAFIHTDEGGVEGTNTKVPFTVTDPGEGGTGTQRFTFSVTPGPLSMSQSGAEVNFGTVQLDGSSHDVPGTLNPIQVSDARGTTVGWSLTGTLSDFAAAGGGTAVIPAGAVSWTPSCAAHADAIGTPTAGAPGALGATPAGLCELPAGGGQVVGGVFDASAGLNLHTPAVIPGGNYAATLTLSLS